MWVGCDAKEGLLGPIVRPSYDWPPTLDHSTSWGEYALGVQPAGWTQMWDPTTGFKVVSEPSAASGRLLEWSTPFAISRNRFALAYDGLGDVGDQEVLTDFRVLSMNPPPAGNPNYMGAAAVRISGTASDERGYAAFFVQSSSPASLDVVLMTWVNGAFRQLASFPLSWQLNTWYSVRLQAIGPNIRARVWARGSAEPANWQI